jgi:hypothetical protein
MEKLSQEQLQDFLENQKTVLFSPSSKLTFGFHPTTFSSLLVSGQRLFGSFFGNGLSSGGFALWDSFIFLRASSIRLTSKFWGLIRQSRSQNS